MVEAVLKDNPSLRPWIPEVGAESYHQAVIAAARETSLERNIFPVTFADTGWGWEQVFDPEFYPD